MRQIVLDTETTGLSAEQGHRIIEIGCLEVVNRRLTGQSLHVYLDPEREIDEAATEVHGMRWEDLRGKPRFADVAIELMDFLQGAQILIHNASFDVSFLDAELERLGQGRFRVACPDVLDTLLMARELHPGKRNSLDALCDRYGISNAHRKLHGALLDAELLAEVYLAMTRGQDSLEMALESAPVDDAARTGASAWPPTGLRVVIATELDLEAHDLLLAGIEKERRAPSLWRQSSDSA